MAQVNRDDYNQSKTAASAAALVTTATATSGDWQLMTPRPSSSSLSLSCSEMVLEKEQEAKTPVRNQNGNNNKNDNSNKDGRNGSGHEPLHLSPLAVSPAGMDHNDNNNDNSFIGPPRSSAKTPLHTNRTVTTATTVDDAAATAFAVSDLALDATKTAATVSPDLGGSAFLATMPEPQTLTALLNDIPATASAANPTIKGEGELQRLEQQLSSASLSAVSASPYQYHGGGHKMAAGSHYYPPSLTASLRSNFSSDTEDFYFMSGSEQSSSQQQHHHRRIDSLQGNLMRAQKSRDPLKIYEVLEVLGEGSMGRVSRVRKRKEAVGGSARPSFVRKHQGCCFPLLQFVQNIFLVRHSNKHNSDSNSRGGIWIDNNKIEESILTFPSSPAQQQQQQNGVDITGMSTVLATTSVGTAGKHNPTPTMPPQHFTYTAASGFISPRGKLVKQHHISDSIPPPLAPPRNASRDSLLGAGNPMGTSGRSTSTWASSDNNNTNSDPSPPPPPQVSSGGRSGLVRGPGYHQQHYNQHYRTGSKRGAASLASSTTSPGGKFVLKKKSSLISFATHPKEVTYALKSIHLNRCSTSVFVDELKNEVDILKSLDHPNIVRAIETYDYRNRLYIVLELCSGGDLYTREPYKEPLARSIISGLLSAVAYLHSKGIVHRDLKFENIMFVNSCSYDIKLIDFGLSQKFAADQHLHDQVGTVYTMAPELLAGDYTSQADVWSCGVISFMLLSSSMPFYGQTRVSVIKKILKGKYRFSARKWSAISLQAREFVAACLTMDPERRPTAAEAQQCPWFKLDFSSSTAASSSAASSSHDSDEKLSNANSTSNKNKNNQAADLTMSTLLPPTYIMELEQMDKIQTSILNFAGYSQLKKLALLIVAYKSTTEEIGFLRKVFDKFDLEHDGEICLNEFQHVLSTHYDYSPEECEIMFRGIDVDGTGKVHYSEFLAATLEAHGMLDETRLAESFDRLDCDDDGYISVQNLRDFLGPDVPERYLEAIMDEADLDSDHRISYDEFMQLWTSDDDEIRTMTAKSVASRHLTPAASFISSISGGNNSTNTDDEPDLYITDTERSIPVVAEFASPKEGTATTVDGKALYAVKDVKLPAPPPLQTATSADEKKEQARQGDVQRNDLAKLPPPFPSGRLGASPKNLKRWKQQHHHHHHHHSGGIDPKQLQDAVEAAACFQTRKALSIRAAVL